VGVGRRDAVLPPPGGAQNHDRLSRRQAVHVHVDAVRHGAQRRRQLRAQVVRRDRVCRAGVSAHAARDEDALRAARRRAVRQDVVGVWQAAVARGVHVEGMRRGAVPAAVCQAGGQDDALAVGGAGVCGPLVAGGAVGGHVQGRDGLQVGVEGRQGVPLPGREQAGVEAVLKGVSRRWSVGGRRGAAGWLVRR